MKLLDSPRRRWYLLAGLWLTLIVIGVGGFFQQSAEGNLGRSALDNLYLTLQLATLDYGGGTEALNWRLNIARFAAPVMAAGTLIQAASVVFREQFSHWRLRFNRGHVVICGLGAAGARLALTLAAEGHRVIGVEANPASPGLAKLKERDIPTLVGDATDAQVLRTARVDRASRVVALTKTDAMNVTVATAVAAIPRSTSRTALRCSVHLTNADLTGLLRGSDLGGTSLVRTEFFNLHERAARALLAEHPVLGASAGDGVGSAAHVVVLGLGQLGRSVVVAAAQQWAATGNRPLAMTLVDRVASGRWHALRLQHPALPGAVDVRCLDLDLGAPSGEAVDTFTAMLADQPPSLVVVTFEDESLALANGLFVHRAVRASAARVVVRTDADSGLGKVMDPLGDDDSFAGLALFPFLDHACSPSILEGGVREELARSLHTDHVATTGAGAGLHQTWDQLSDEERESSRHAADGVIDGLADLGYELLPLRQWGARPNPLSHAEVEQLAAREHDRWKAEREADGWRYGPTRDDAAKHNPLLVAWADVPDEAKTYNRESIQAMPARLARAGFELARLRG